jgi:NAD(P)-dependent dehydrogenase (short-subunit alcohol dehydrogenase family)
VELDLENVPCVVTGGSRGIGLAVVRQLAREGARVLLIGRDAEAAAQAAAESAVEWLAIDVRRPESADRIVRECLRRFGGITVLVNNAGATAEVPLNKLTDDDWQRQFDLNVLAPMRLMRAAAPLRPQQEGGESSTSPPRREGAPP